MGQEFSVFQEHNIRFQLNDNDTAIALTLNDTRGIILEGYSGAFSKAGGTDSFEFAMSALSILPGSSITINGTTSKLTEGSIWLDRQTIGMEEKSPSKELFTPQAMEVTSSKAPPSNPLYVGNWIAVTMDDGTQYSITFFWPKASVPGINPVDCRHRAQASCGPNRKNRS